MPTQEERLTILEYDLKQYKTETIKAYGEMAIEVIMVKGLMEDAVKRLASLRTQFEQRFERVDTRLDAMDTRLDKMETRLDRVETRLDAMDAHLESMETRLDQMDMRLDAMGPYLEGMDRHLDQMDTRLDRVQNMLAQILARLPEKP
jgi:chromosome segregation ATPase